MKTFLGLRCNKEYTKKSGRNALYILVGIEKQYAKIPLNLDWPAALLDEGSNQLKEREKDDKDCNDYNLIIRMEMSKANDIFVQCRLQKREISMEEFLKTFNNYLRLQDFTTYMWDKIQFRYKGKKIAESTKRSHVNTYLWLVQYRKSILFKDLNKSFIENFERWLMRQPNRRAKDKKRLDENTVANVMKYFKAYITLAIDDKIPLENPFKSADVQTHQNEKEIEHLRPKEVAEMIEYYNTPDLPVGTKLSLCRLLIACHISLRISDILNINPDKLKRYKQDRKISFQPVKQIRTKKQKTVYVSIDDHSMQYLEDCVRLKTEAVAAGYNISESYGRKTLKQVGQKLGLPISGYHIGRHTFATSYLRAGGLVTDLQHIMGHSNIKTTMRYIHIVDDDTEEHMVSLSNLYRTTNVEPAGKNKISLDIPDNIHRKVKQLQLELEDEDHYATLNELYFMLIQKGILANGLSTAKQSP